MTVRPMNKMKNKNKSRKDFRDTSDRLKEEYLDRYEGVNQKY